MTSMPYSITRLAARERPAVGLLFLRRPNGADLLVDAGEGELQPAAYDQVLVQGRR
ncbi:hypothetical protein [Streptomyces sp. NPDC054901]